MSFADTETRSAQHEPMPLSAEAIHPRVAARLHALKDGDTFVIADALGDILGASDGMFHNDTRVLSELRLTLAGQSPSLLSAAVSRDNVLFVSHMTNRPLPPLGGRSIPEGVIHLERARFLRANKLYERIELVNYGDREALVPLGLRFGADFRDMFEVRGQTRGTRGTFLPVEIGRQQVLFRYRGLDNILRSTVIAFSLTPLQLMADRAEFSITLAPDGSCELFMCIGTAEDAALASRPAFRQAAAQARRAMRKRMRRGSRPHSSARLFNQWLQKSQADLAL